ncbi:GspH/FimT family pseudopilin [Methyloversatilis thermotolerans]|uniref:GspH/FimT family pseudopilin n=1 Tax=Methyloversatilis thermotolerans TaxID=1346290 RepID=UPI00037EABBC|nr:GspH/FimT family pseudopilin [Methyloversatilis thermotolerans]
MQFFSAPRGFTLLELMITVAILTVIAAFAAPSFQSLITGNRLTSEANELLAALGQARSEAIRLNRRTVLCRAGMSAGQVDAASGCAADADGSWLAWMLFVDADASGQYNPDASNNPDEVLVRAHALQAGRFRAVAGSLLAGDGNRIVFRPDGLARAAGQTSLQTVALRLCDSSGSAQQNARDVRVSGGSRLSVSRVTSSDCAAPEAG